MMIKPSNAVESSTDEFSIEVLESPIKDREQRMKLDPRIMKLDPRRMKLEPR